jgi:hypothetical protein
VCSDRVISNPHLPGIQGSCDLIGEEVNIGLSVRQGSKASDHSVTCVDLRGIRRFDDCIADSRADIVAMAHPRHDMGIG